ncbi:leukotriene C4 synthase-like isoform X4 [Coturnix japonica]|nr:leukotriene C4 synthase-like isoform X4 [Coturnix japonica]
MLEQIHLLAAVTVLGVLEQGYRWFVDHGRKKPEIQWLYVSAYCLLRHCTATFLCLVCMCPALAVMWGCEVIHARRTFGVSPPNISGPPEFERIFRAQVNSSEYFPIFVALLWQAGLFFHQGLAAALGLLYLYSRYCYFMGYRASSSDRLAPIYFSTGVLWVLVAAATLGLVHFFLCHYVGLNVLRLLAA